MVPIRKIASPFSNRNCKSSLSDPSNIIQTAPQPLTINANQINNGEYFLRNNRSKIAAKSGRSVKIAAIETVVVNFRAINIKTKYIEYIAPNTKYLQIFLI